jgi:hypothetical protein
VAESLALIAEARAELGQGEEATELAERALAIAGPLLPVSHPVIRRARALAAGEQAPPSPKATEGPYR